MIFTGIFAVKWWMWFAKTTMEIITPEDFEEKKKFATFSDSDVECHIPHQYSA